MSYKILKNNGDTFEFEYENRILYSSCLIITIAIFIVSITSILLTPDEWGLLSVPVGMLVVFLIMYNPKTRIIIDVPNGRFEKHKITRVTKGHKVRKIPVENIDKVDVFELGSSKTLIVYLQDDEMIPIFQTSKTNEMDIIFKNVAKYVDPIMDK
ncbi:MAG: hypothetical protein ACFFCS_01870 [Candidatus Hodarchaeota archaeon]